MPRCASRAEVTGPELDASGRVIGVMLKSGEKVLGDAVIAADGAYSPIKRALKLDSRVQRLLGDRDPRGDGTPTGRTPTRSTSISSWRSTATSCPATAGCSRSAAAGSTSASATSTATRTGSRSTPRSSSASSCKTLPREWDLPSIEELKKNKSVRAWRLPMGFTAWPPWRPGVLFAGDSLGAARPASGAGISKALRVGSCRRRVRVAALSNGGPDDFTNYAQRMEAAWGREYRRGRYFHKLVGIPAIANAGLKVLDGVNHPGFRAHFLFWEGWRDPNQGGRRAR